MTDDAWKVDPAECEPGEFERWLRVKAESETAVAMMTDEACRRVLVETIRAVFSALDDMDEVPVGLHPADVVEKYIQRGNIEKDGDW